MAPKLWRPTCSSSINLQWPSWRWIEKSESNIRSPKLTAFFSTRIASFPAPPRLLTCILSNARNYKKNKEQFIRRSFSARAHWFLFFLLCTISITRTWGSLRPLVPLQADEHGPGADGWYFIHDASGVACRRGGLLQEEAARDGAAGKSRKSQVSFKWSIFCTVFCV